MLKNLLQTYRRRNLFLLLVFITQIPKLAQMAKRHPIPGFKMIPNVLKRKVLLLVFFIFCLGTSYAQCPVATFSYTGTPYCQDVANPSPSFSGGGVAGIFSS